MFPPFHYFFRAVLYSSFAELLSVKLFSKKVFPTPVLDFVTIEGRQVSVVDNEPVTVIPGSAVSQASNWFVQGKEYKGTCRANT